MKVTTVQQMRDMDRRAIEEIGIPGMALMEKAGSGAMDAACRHYGTLRGRRVVILCGGGNNGGDGLVAARYAVNQGAEVEVLLLTRKEKIRGDARINLEILEKLGHDLIEIRGDTAEEEIKEKLAGADLIVDALLGSGLTGEVEGLYRVAVGGINKAGGKVIAIDGPSGIDMDTGARLGTAVRADLTVTFGLPKRGHFLYPGKACCGDLEVIDIGFPIRMIEETQITTETLEHDMVTRMLPPRGEDSHKGDFGHLLVLAGSVGYSGAAALAAGSALRVGAGLVTLAIPERLNPTMEAKLTEVITRPLPETKEGSLSREAVDPAAELAAGMDAAVLGPGLGSHPETVEFVREFILRCDIPLLLDADGINALADRTDLLNERSIGTIMTPHPGEFGRLLSITGSEVNSRRLELCEEYAARWGVVLVLKGAPTIISEAENGSRINTTGNAGLATGGTGGVLSGAIGGFLAQGLDPFHAALCGTHYHGLAGDMACGETGQRGMIAGDVMELLPESLLS